MRNLGLLALIAASNMFAVTITVTPTSGPDYGSTGFYTSPSFPDWATNVINGMINSTTPGVDQFAYVPIANGSTISPTEFISTPFESWKGVTPGPYAGEQGNALYFSVKVIGSEEDTFRVTDLGGVETYLGTTFAPWDPGSFDTFDYKLVGRKAADGLLTQGGDSNTTLLTELYYVGLGFVQPLDTSGGGSNQDMINATVAGVLALKDRTTQVCYSVGEDTGCGSVEVGIPEPGSYMLFGAGLAGIAWLRRRSA